MDALPTLAVDGFTTDKAVIVTKLYEYFLASDYSQTNTFFNGVASLKYILGEAKGMTELDTMIKDALTNMYSKYFPVVVVDTIPDETDSKVGLSVNVLVTDDAGNNYRLNELIDITDNNIINYDKKQEALHA